MVCTGGWVNRPMPGDSSSPSRWRSQQVVGVIRADRSATVVHARTREAWLIMASIAAAVLALASAISVLLARRINRPVEALTGAVRAPGRR